MWHIYMYVRMLTRKLLTIYCTMQKTLCMVGSRWNQSMNYWSLKRKFFLSTNIGGLSELQLSTTTAGPPGKITIFCDFHKVLVKVEIYWQSEKPFANVCFHAPTWKRKEQSKNRGRRKQEYNKNLTCGAYYRSQNANFLQFSCLFCRLTIFAIFLLIPSVGLSLPLNLLNWDQLCLLLPPIRFPDLMVIELNS